MTQRDAEQSGREFRSSPFRYGKSTSAFVGSSSIQLGFVGFDHEAHAEHDATLISDVCVLGKPTRVALRPARRVQERSDPLNRLSSETRGTSSATWPDVPHTAAYSRLALPTGQDRLWIARVIVKPVSTIRSSPTSRVSPWAMVLVAISPRVPRGRKQGLRAQEEVGDLVGAALRPAGEHVHEPVA